MSIATQQYDLKKELKDISSAAPAASKKRHDTSDNNSSSQHGKKHAKKSDLRDSDEEADF